MALYTKTESSAQRAIERAQQNLLERQDSKGWWKGALDTNVSMDAEDMLLREFLGIRTETETAEAADWIRGRRRRREGCPDGCNVARRKPVCLGWLSVAEQDIGGRFFLRRRPAEQSRCRRRRRGGGNR